MTSKHCSYKDNCIYSNDCLGCAHGRQYERMAHKISDLYAENKRFKQELAMARRVITNYPGVKDGAS